MRRLRQWVIRLTTSLTRRQDESRLREEIDDHIAFETDANLRRGLPPAEARRRALLAFGSMETFKENYRDQQGVPVLEHLLQDARLALRRMWKTPGFTVAAIATLALGLGLTSAVMTLAYALFLRPLPVDDATRIVHVDQTRVDLAARPSRHASESDRRPAGRVTNGEGPSAQGRRSSAGIRSSSHASCSSARVPPRWWRA